METREIARFISEMVNLQRKAHRSGYVAFTSDGTYRGYRVYADIKTFNTDELVLSVSDEEDMTVETAETLLCLRRLLEAMWVDPIGVICPCQIQSETMIIPPCNTKRLPFTRITHNSNWIQQG